MRTAEERAVLLGDIALVALARITELLDEDSDATGIALYNPRSTVNAIRTVLARSADALESVLKEERAELPTLPPEAIL